MTSAGAESISAEQFVRGTTWRILTFLLVETLLPFLITPYLLHVLGSREFGAWVFFVALSGWVAFADLGVGISVPRAVGLHFARGETQALRRSFSSAFYHCLLAAVVVVAAAFLGGPFLLDQLLGPGGSAYQPVLMGVVVWAAAALILRVLAGAMAGLQWIGLQQGVGFVMGILASASTIGCLWAGWGLAGLAWVLAGVTGLQVLLLLFLLRWKRCPVTYDPRLVSLQEVRRTVAFGLVLHLMALLAYVFQSDRLFLAASGQPLAAVAAYSLGAALVSKASALVVQLAAAVFPSTPALSSDPARLRSLALRGTKLQSMVAGILFGFLLAFADPLITFWIGHPLPDAVRVACLLVPWGFTGIIHTLTGIGAGLGKPGFQLKSSILAILFGAILYAGGLGRSGPAGIAATVSISVFSVAAIYLFDFRRHILPIDLPGFLLRSILLPLVPALLVVPLLPLVRVLGPVHDRLSAAVVLLPAGILYVGGYLLLARRLGILDARDIELLGRLYPRGRWSSHSSV